MGNSGGSISRVIKLSMQRIKRSVNEFLALTHPQVPSSDVGIQTAPIVILPSWRGNHYYIMCR